MGISFSKTYKKFITVTTVFFLFSAIAECLSSPFNWSEPKNITTLNSAADDFAPVWNNAESTLYFNSVRSGKSKFYISKIEDGGVFSVPVQIRGGLNASNGNVSFITFYDESEATLSAYRMSGRRSYLNLFSSQKKRGAWTEPIPLESLACECFCSHPTVSPNGKMLVYSSDKNLSLNDTDLWLAYRQSNGSWGDPINLADLNSTGNEITPFFASDDTLFFASDGMEGPGGFDLYYSVYSSGKWQKPYPVTSLNTRFNESDLSIMPGGEAVFASDRPGGAGNLDLYIALPLAIEKNSRTNEIQYELNISVQAPYIKASISMDFFQVVLPNFFTVEDIASFTKVSMPENIDITNEYYIAPADSLPQQALAYICNQLSYKKDMPLYISYYNLNSDKIYILLSNFKKKISDYYSIDSSRIIINQPINDLSYPSGLCLTTNLNSIYPQLLRAGKKAVSVEPPVLSAEINIRPVTNTLKWEAFLHSPKGKLALIGSDTTANARIDIDISKYSEVIGSSEFLNIYLIVSDTLGNNSSEAYSLPVHRSQLSKNYSTINGTSGSVYLLPKMIFTDEYDFMQLIDSIATLENNPAKIHIYTPKDVSDNDKALSEKLISSLKRIYNQTQAIQNESLVLSAFPESYRTLLKSEFYFLLMFER
jgi:hypothetical protein